ncbi:MAG: divergent polysaccharide deacetylase family protein [Desulfobacterales bacterium]|nr:divergent polysaccharide deacetylase family protein [Desulfobacterales bacterium]
MNKKNSSGSKILNKRHLKQNIKRIKPSVKNFVYISFIILFTGIFAFLIKHYSLNSIENSNTTKTTILPVTKKNNPPNNLNNENAKQNYNNSKISEFFSEKELLKSRKPVINTNKHLPKVAIIIDDMGYDYEIAQKFIDLKIAITFSIFPHGPLRKQIALLATNQGYEVMLHLPMEPIEYPMVNPGKDALLTSMSPDEILEQLNKDIDSVPSIKGVNNHMGSKMTTVSNQIYQIFSILKKRDLYFIDSRTTKNTVCKASARLLQIKFAKRDIFLDHEVSYNFIRNQVNQLIQTAKKKKKAVAIGHPHHLTYEVLKETLPLMKKEVEFVCPSELVKVVNSEYAHK